MDNKVVANIIRFIVLIFLQVLILNNINFAGYINPYLYILFILLFPFSGNQSLFLFLSFLLGLSIDVFEDSGGINAAACLIAAFARPGLLRFSFGISYDHQNIKLSNAPIGARLSYIFLMVLLHHFVLFSLEMFSLNHILLILKKTLFSSIFTVSLVFLILSLFSKKYR